MSINDESPGGELSEFETQFVPRSNDDEVLWEVIEIVAERDKKYQVRWAGNDPKTGKSWPLDWVPKRDCTNYLVKEWKKKKAEKKRRSKKTGGQITANSRSRTLSKVSTTSAFRKTRSVSEEENMLTDYEEPPRAQPSTSTSKPQSSKRKRVDIAKILPDISESAETPEPELHPKKKRKLTPGQELSKQNAHHTLTSRDHSIESDADNETVATTGDIPARKRRITKPKACALPSTPDKCRITAIKTTTKPKRSSGHGQSTAFSKKQRDVMTLSADRVTSRFLDLYLEPSDDMMSDPKIATKKVAKHFEAHPPVALRVSPPKPSHHRSPPSFSAPLPRHQPILSPGARARLEIFDSMMGIGSDEGNIDDPFANSCENADYCAADNFESYELPTNSPPKFPTPPPTTTTAAAHKKQPRDSPFSGIVPETESSQSQPSLRNPRADEKNADAPPPPKPPSRPTSPSEKQQSKPPIAVMRAPSSSRSPSHIGHVASSSDVPVRPRKRATRPIPRISPQTFCKAVEPFTSELDNEPPMSSIESFPSPRKDKGKKRQSADADEYQGTSDEEIAPGRTDTELRTRGEALYKQALREKELLHVTDRPLPKKALADVARSKVPPVNGKPLTSDTHLSASSKRDRQADQSIMQQMEDAYVDLSGGNSTTIDTFTQSGPQDKEAQRITLREEVEETTQEALLSGNPALPMPQVNVVEVQPQELVIENVDICGENGDVQPSPAVPAEGSGSNQPSNYTDDLQVASMIVNPSQGQLQERDDEVITIDLASSPIRSAQNNTDGTMGRLNHALSALNKKSDEIQALQLELILEREKSSKLEDELKAARQSTSSTTQEVSASSADPAGAMQSHPAVSELDNVRAKWDKEREVWEAERCVWKVELASVTAERDRLETDMRGVDDVRASWEDERNKLGLQVADGQSEQRKWSEERARLADQITSLTETCSAFEAERAQWKQERDTVIAERAAWASERETRVLEQAASAREGASRDVYRESMELQSAKWEADRVEWASSKESWEAEREKWSAECAAMIEAREALNADVERLNVSLDAITRSKALAEKDRDFFRDQYTQASGFVSTTRAENVELEQKAAIAEGRARDGVALIKSMFESQINALKEDVDRWRGVAALLQEKDRRTDDLIRRRAAEQPELVDRCRQLEDQVDHLHAELELAHQKSFLESNKLSRTFSEVPSLTYPDVEPGEIIEVTTLPDPNTTWIQDALAADLSAEEAEDDECGLYPCRWKTGPTVIDQCQQAFDCKEDLNRHMHDYHYCDQLERCVRHD